MHNDIYIMLIAIIAVLVVHVVVHIGYILNTQSNIDDKNEAIIQEMRENIQLRDELRNRLNRAAS